MNQLQVFNNPEFGEIRTMEIDGKPYAVGADVARALGYKDTVNAIKQHCRGVVKHHIIDKLGRKQQASFIPEGDLYRLIANSKLPAAARFESWVFDEVLPSIRKHGAYMTSATIEDVLNNPDTLIRLATQLKEERAEKERLQIQAETNKPKVTFADSVTASDHAILIRELAKYLKQNGIDTGEKRLYEWLRGNGYLIRVGSDYNLPTQKSMDLGLFEINRIAINTANGTKPRATAKVTGKGQLYFLNKFLTERDNELGLFLN